jgi:hypothetical protein
MADILPGLFGASSLPSGPTSQTTQNQSSTGTNTGVVSPWAQPYVNNYLTQAQNLVTNQQTPALLNQSYAGAAGLQIPGGFATATDLAAKGGYGNLSTVPMALDYGAQGAAYGAQGPQYGAAGAQYGAAGAEYGAQGTQYGNLGTAYGAQGAGLGVAGGSQYGGLGAQYGAQGTNLGITGGAAYGAQGAGYGQQATAYGQQATQAGQNYANQATSPQAMQAYMSPYMQDVVDYQKQQAVRDYQIQAPQMAAQAVGSGAFGGNRLTLQQSEANRGLQNRLAGIDATGQQQAYQNAQQAQQYGASLGLQGLQAGIQGQQAGIQGSALGLQGVGTQLAGTAQGMQGAGVGLQGVGTQLAGTSQGMQGAGVGLQGLGTAMQGTQLGMQGSGVGLAGLGTAMQGSQVGLQGVGGAQAGYSGATQAGGTLGNIAAQQNAAKLANLQFQNQLGLQQQQFPYTQLDFLKNQLSGLPVSSSTTTGTQQGTTQGYQSPSNALSQIAGLGTTAAATYGLLKAKGGIIRNYASGGLVTLALDRAMRGAA